MRIFFSCTPAFNDNAAFHVCQPMTAMAEYRTDFYISTDFFYIFDPVTWILA